MENSIGTTKGTTEGSNDAYCLPMDKNCNGNLHLVLKMKALKSKITPSHLVPPVDTCAVWSNLSTGKETVIHSMKRLGGVGHAGVV